MSQRTPFDTIVYGLIASGLKFESAPLFDQDDHYLPLHVHCARVDVDGDGGQKGGKDKGGKAADESKCAKKRKIDEVGKDGLAKEEGNKRGRKNKEYPPLFTTAVPMSRDNSATSSTGTTSSGGRIRGIPHEGSKK